MAMNGSQRGGGESGIPVICQQQLMGLVETVKNGLDVKGD
jgi:hypothetical protein